jgi:hypothetical protein
LAGIAPVASNEPICDVRPEGYWATNRFAPLQSTINGDRNIHSFCVADEFVADIVNNAGLKVLA